jgi:hypothetical protein
VIAGPAETKASTPRQGDEQHDGSHAAS